MIQQIDKMNLTDGSILEIRFQDRWFEKPGVKKAFEKIIVASKVEENKPVLRFFFVHPSYFRAFEEFGLPLLFMPIVANYDKYQPQIARVIQSSKETANLEFSEFTKKIAPIILKVFVKPFFQWLREAKEQTQELEEEEGIKKQFVYEAVEKLGESTTDKVVIKKFMKKHISPEIFTSALGLGRTTFNVISHTLVEKGLERYRLLANEISDDNLELCGRTTNGMLECDMATPLVTVAVCMNKHCKHTELTISDRIPEAYCGKCKGDTLSTTFTFINKPYLWLKDKMLDLHAFLYCYVESKSTPEYIDGKLKPDLQCLLNPYIRNRSNQNQREVDALIYSTTTKKTIAIEIKIHQIRSQLPQDRLQNIIDKDLRQLTETLQQTNLKTGCYITNLKISEEEIKNIKENTIPRLIKNTDEKEIEIISATDETTFLRKLDTLIASIQKDN